jgi:hypothetical protein
MNLIRLLAPVMILLGMQTAEACQPFAADVYAREASLIAVGRAVGARELGAPEYGLMILATVDEVLKGDAPGDLEGISPCGSPIGAGERVIVARIGTTLVVLPADMYEEIFRAAAANTR